MSEGKAVREKNKNFLKRENRRPCLMMGGLLASTEVRKFKKLAGSGGDSLRPLGAQAPG